MTKKETQKGLKGSLKQSLKPIILNGNSIIKFLPLTRVREPDGRYYVGRRATSTYLHLKEKYAEIIRLCNGKRRLREVVEIYSQYHNIPKNKGKRKVLLRETLQLIDQLKDFKFVHFIDDIQLQAKKRRRKTLDRSTFLRFMFSVPAFAVYFFIFYVGFLITINNSSFFPKARDIFWHPSLLISVISQLIISIILISKHELSHLLAARSYGVDGNIHLSNRIFYLIAETELDDIYMLPRKQRAIIYLAGIASDSLVYGISLILLKLNGTGSFIIGTLFAKFLKQLVVLSWISILWQFRFFMKTDIYAFFEDYTGCDELLELAKSKIKYRVYKLLNLIFHRFSNKVKKYKSIFKDELYLNAQRILSWYVWFVVIGIGLTVYQFVLFDFPISLIAIKGGWTKIIIGYQTKTKNLIFEGNIILFVQLFYWGLLTYVIIKDIFLKKQKRWDENIAREVKEKNSSNKAKK